MTRPSWLGVLLRRLELGRRESGVKRGWRDMDLLGKSDHEFTVTRKQPFGVDDRETDDLAGGIEPQHVTLGRLLAVGRRLALTDVEVQDIAHLVVGGMVECEMSDVYIHVIHLADPCGCRTRSRLSRGVCVEVYDHEQPGRSRFASSAPAWASGRACDGRAT